MLVRKLIGTGGELFMFHQEWRSTEKAISLAANYVSFCLSSHRPHAFNSPSADIQTAIQQIRAALSPTCEAEALIGPVLTFFIQELKS